MQSQRVIRYVLIGLLGGFLSGFAGIGGGVVLIPLMVGLLGLSQHKAHGTSLAIIIPTAIVSVTQSFVAPGAGKPPPLDLAVAYAATAMIGAPLGARLITLVNPKSLRQLFGLLLLSLSVGTLTRKTPMEPYGTAFLTIGLLVLVIGAIVIAIRQRQQTAAVAAAAAPGATR